MELGNINTIYFLGIGGIGMSALARYFAAKGYRVLGYDRTPSALTQELQNEGIIVEYGDDCSLVEKEGITVKLLEGDYTNTQSEKILDDSEVEMLPTPLIDYLYTSNLKLLEMPTSKPIPFSDTLIEFLLWNAINNLDSINNNMDRLLLAISRIIEDPSLNRFANYWYAQYRKLVSDIGRNYNNIVVRDNLGYVTKNLEQVINTTTNADSYINDYPYGN
jgi:hypothetical protein